MSGTVLITGGTGFIGRHLVHELAASEPATTLRILSRHPDAVERPEGSRIEPVLGDLATPATLTGLFEGVTAVFHLAGLKGEPDATRPPDLYRRVNVEATRVLLEMGTQAGVSLFVHMSSTGVFGNNGIDRCDEESPGAPGNLYEQTKLEAEEIVRSFGTTEGPRRLILRPSNVFGEDHPERHLLTLMRSIERGRFALLRGREAWVNYVYVKDVARAAVELSRDQRAEGTFIVNDECRATAFVESIRRLVGSGRKIPHYPYWPTLTVGTILDGLGKVTGRRFPLTASKVRALANRQVFSSERVRRVCDGYPAWGLERGLRKTVEHYRAQGWL